MPADGWLPPSPDAATVASPSPARLADAFHHHAHGHHHHHHHGGGGGGVRVPSVTPPKAPPPYSTGPRSPDADAAAAATAAAVRAQAAAAAAAAAPTPARRSGLEGVALKYEAAVTEAAALRLQVEALRRHVSDAAQHGGLRASDPLPLQPVASPPRRRGGGGGGGDASSSSRPPPQFASEEEEAMWGAMNVDVVTKLEALDAVERMRLEYVDAQRELRQELEVKEEVLSMLTDQLKGMVDRGRLSAAHDDLRRQAAAASEVERQRDLLAAELSERDAEAERLRLATDAAAADAGAAASAAAADAQARLIEEVHEANGRAADEQAARLDAGRRLAEQEEALVRTGRALHEAGAAVAAQEAQLEGLRGVEGRLSENEAVVRGLADSLQAQAEAHKQALADAQAREAALAETVRQRDGAAEDARRLQAQAEERRRGQAEAQEALAAREEEVRALQAQLDGFTDHLQAHLLEKDEETRRAHEVLHDEVRAARAAAEAADGRAGAGQAAAQAALAEARAEAAAQAARADALEEGRAALLEEAAQAARAGERARADAEDAGMVAARLADGRLAAAAEDLAAQRSVGARLEEELRERGTLTLVQQDTIAALQEKLQIVEAALVAQEELQGKNKVLGKTILDLRTMLKTKEDECSEAMVVWQIIFLKKGIN